MTPSINRRDVLDKSWEEVWRVQTAIFWNSSQNQCSGNTKSKLILKFGTAVFLVLQVSTTSSAWETKQTNKKKTLKNLASDFLFLLIFSHRLCGVHILASASSMSWACHPGTLSSRLRSSGHPLLSGVVKPLLVLLLLATIPGCTYSPPLCQSELSVSLVQLGDTCIPNSLASPSGKDTSSLIDKDVCGFFSCSSNHPHCKFFLCPILVNSLCPFSWLLKCQ